MYQKANSKQIRPLWQADTRTMNPTIPQALIDRETKKDPSAARAEWQAEFREDIESFLDPDMVEACAVLPGVMAFQKYTIYSAFTDPSGGRADAFTLSIGHHNYNKKKFSIDLVKAWHPPFNPSDVVEDIAATLSEYRINRVTGDRYAAAWVSEAFEKKGVTYEQCGKQKSDLYLDLEGYINTAQVEFPNNKHLITELVNLERRRGKSGKDTIDHPPRGSDDLANSLAGVCHVLTSIERSAFTGCDLT